MTEVMIAHLSSPLQAVISQKALLQAVNQMTDLVHIEFPKNTRGENILRE